MKKIAKKILSVLAWPGIKLVEMVLGSPLNWADGLLQSIFGFPVFLVGIAIFWGGIVAIVGNAIAFAIRGHF